MASDDIDIRLRTNGESEFRALAQRLRRAGSGELEKKLRSNIRAAGRPVLAQLKVAVMAVEVQSSKGGHAPPSYSRLLRKRISSALRMSVAYKGIRFAVQSQLLGEGKYSENLPRYLDGELPGYKNWRHPVFGKEPWVVQHGKPWFFVTIRAHAGDFEDACVKAINEIVMEAGR